MQGPPMFVDPVKVPAGWLRNARLKPGVVPARTKLGAPVSVHPTFPVDRLIAEGYVGLYLDLKKMETVDDVVERVKSFDALDLFGDGS